MSRFIFLKPIEPDATAIRFKEKIKEYNGGLTDTVMCKFLHRDGNLFNKEVNVTPRDLRTIKARWNYDKYKNDTSNDLIITINGKYHLVDKNNERKALAKLDIDLYWAAKKRSIALRKRGLIDQTTLALESFINEYELEMGEK